MKIEGNLAKLSAGDKWALGLRGEKVIEFVQRLPVAAALDEANAQVEKVTDEILDEYSLFSLSLVTVPIRHLLAERKLKHVTHLAQQVLVHEADQFLAAHITPDTPHDA